MFFIISYFCMLYKHKKPFMGKNIWQWVKSVDLDLAYEGQKSVRIDIIIEKI